MYFREARREDRASIVALTLSAYAEYEEHLAPENFAAYMDDIRRTLQEDNRPTYLLGEENDRLAVSALLYPPGCQIYSDLPAGAESAELRLLAVSPDCRRSGYGRTMVEECIRRARTLGAQGLSLHTSDIMQGAMALYETMGFRRAHELDFSPRPGLLIKGYLLRF
jgi:GNAT superfamily N-acetyltransferase